MTFTYCTNRYSTFYFKYIKAIFGNVLNIHESRAHLGNISFLIFLGSQIAKPKDHYCVSETIMMK